MPITEERRITAEIAVVGEATDDEWREILRQRLADDEATVLTVCTKNGDSDDSTRIH